MPKVYTYNAEFNPLSFAERIAPMQLYQEEYDKQEAAYLKLLEDASSLEILKDIEMDKDSYEIYDKFKQDIVNAADLMEREGYNNPEVQNAFMDLRRRSRTEIMPLQDKQAIRASGLKNQIDWISKNPNYLLDPDSDFTSIPLSQLNSTSVFKPGINLDTEREKIAQDNYNRIMNKQVIGDDNIDPAKIRNRLSYDTRSSGEKRAIDNMINGALFDAQEAARLQKHKEKVEEIRAGRTGNGYDQNGIDKAELQDLPDGTATEIRRRQLNDGTVEVSLKDINGSSRIIRKQKDKGDITNSEFNRAYFGHDYLGNQKYGDTVIPILCDFERDKNGDVVLDENGKPKVTAYYTYVRGKNGVEFRRMTDLSKNSILSAWTGNSKGYMSADKSASDWINGVSSTAYNFDEFSDKMKKNNGTVVELRSIYDLKGLSDEYKAQIAKACGIVDKNVYNNSVINDELSKLFSLGYRIEIERKIVNGKVNGKPKANFRFHVVDNEPEKQMKPKDAGSTVLE